MVSDVPMHAWEPAHGTNMSFGVVKRCVISVVVVVNDNVASQIVVHVVVGVVGVGHDRS